jgi:adenine-specific DNA glycosylase
VSNLHIQDPVIVISKTNSPYCSQSVIYPHCKARRSSGSRYSRKQRQASQRCLQTVSRFARMQHFAYSQQPARTLQSSTTFEQLSVNRAEIDLIQLATHTKSCRGYQPILRFTSLTREFAVISKGKRKCFETFIAAISWVSSLAFIPAIIKSRSLRSSLPISTARGGKPNSV